MENDLNGSKEAPGNLAEPYMYRIRRSYRKNAMCAG